MDEAVMASSLDGRYRARCGGVVTSGSLTAEPAPVCALCMADRLPQGKR